jgi:hypothetical protein
MNTTTVYAEIVKAERNEAGDLVVVGKATGPDLDLDHQICDPEWLGKAMPKWFSTGANIREMHQGIAAGVGTELEQTGDSWMVTSTVIDPVSAKKVEAGVLKGYSIGISAPKVIKDAKAPGGRIVDGSIVEVSLVDRPCNPTAMLMLSKAAKPGMTVKASQLDHDRMLVKVEEFVEIPDAVVEPVEPAAEQPDELVTIPLSAEADTTKTSVPGAPTAPDTEHLTELVQAEVRKATEASEERYKALEAQLAKVLATPVPGGPAITRRAEDEARAVDIAKNAEAQRYRRLADQVTDRDMADYYRTKAAQLTSAPASEGARS